MKSFGNKALSTRISTILGLVTLLGLNHFSVAQEPDAKPLNWTLKPFDSSAKELKGFQCPEWLRIELVANLNFKTEKFQFGIDGSLYVLGTNNPEKTGGSQLHVYQWKNNAFIPANKTFEAGEPILDFALDAKSVFIATGTRLLKISTDLQGEQNVILNIKSQEILKSAKLNVATDGWVFLSLPPNNLELITTAKTIISSRGSGAIVRISKEGKNAELYCTGLGVPTNGTFQDSSGNWFFANETPPFTKSKNGALFYIRQTGADYGFRTPDFLANYGLENPERYSEGLIGRLNPLCKLPEVGRFNSIYHHPSGHFPAELDDYWFATEQKSSKIIASKLIKTSAGMVFGKPNIIMDLPEQSPTHFSVGPDGTPYLLVASANGNGESLLLRCSFRQANEDNIASKSMEKYLNQASMDFDNVLKSTSEMAESQVDFIAGLFSKFTKEHKPRLLKEAVNSDQRTFIRLAAFEALVEFWDNEVQSAALELLESGENILCIQAAKALGDHAPRKSEATFNALLKHLGSENITLRKEVILATGKINAPGSADSLINGVLFYDGADPMVVDSFARALEFAGNDGLERLTSVGDSGVKKDLRKAIDTLCMMKTLEVAVVIPDWLKNVNLSPDDKTDLIRSLRIHSMVNSKDYSGVFVKIIKGNPGSASEKIAVLESLRGLSEIIDPIILQWVEDRLRESNDDVKKAAADTVRIKKLKSLKGPAT